MRVECTKTLLPGKLFSDVSIIFIHSDILIFSCECLTEVSECYYLQTNCEKCVKGHSVNFSLLPLLLLFFY